MRALSLTGVILVGLVVGACGSDQRPNEFPGEGPPGSPTGTGTGNLPPPPSFGDGGFDSSSSGDAACAASVAETNKAKVDLIFVIDNSGSMTEEMRQIKVNVNTFAQTIGTSGLDYQVLFIVRKATSPTQTGNVICVPAPLAGANCADNPPRFHHINQDVQSNNSLTLILSTYDSTNMALNWKQHLRPEAYKVFIEVTDDESSLASAAFDTQLLAKAPAGMFGTATARKYIFHSIVGWTDGTANLTGPRCSTAVNIGLRYQELSKLTGGIIDSVCKTDYSGVLGKLATGIVEKLGCELTVPSSATSDPTSVVVQVVPPGGTPKNLTQVTDASKCATVPDAWYYDNNTAPTKILLCPTTCTALTNASKVQALVGCKAPQPK